MDFTRRNQNRPSSRLAIPLRRERFPLIDLEALDEETALAAKRAGTGASGLQEAAPAEQAVETAQPESAVAVAHPEQQPAITRRLPRALPARSRAGKDKTA
jgi:hypothetical protein